MKKSKIILLSILAVVVLALGGGLFYLTNSFPVVEQQLSAQEMSTYEYTEHKDYFYFPSQTENKKEGVIIYQGAKVQPLNYARIANGLQQQGYEVFIGKMPFTWSFLKGDLAGDIINEFSTITSWYLGGHSLGGAMISSYADKNLTDKIAGVFFLAAYPATDMSQTSVPMLYIFAENDGLITSDKREKALLKGSNSPFTRAEYIIGGNHAQFGNYGKQAGDNDATIDHILQQEQTVGFMVKWMMEIKMKA
ncbi:MAG: alpha/beta hydrolase [Culicoidibacterales bacterium]